MKSGRSWLVYSLIRIGLFLGVFVILYLVGLEWYWAALAAALISMSLSIIFLQKPREEAAESLYRARHDKTAHTTPTLGEDEAVEDAVVDTSAADRDVRPDTERD